MHIHCLSLDRARSRDKQWSCRHRRPALRGPVGGGGGDRARSQLKEEQRRGIGVVAVAGGTVRRRSRQAVPRPKVVQFSLTEEEFAEVSAGG